MLGRTFAPSDVPTPQDPPRIAVISYLFWKRHFNSDPSVVGKTIKLDHQPYTALGVVPPGIVIGLAASLALSSMIAQYVTGWNPKDPVALVAVVFVLTMVAMLASWLPAHRATKIEPTAALRHD